MLEDRVILVTGAHGGIGLACAARCVELGAKVAIHARAMSKLEAPLAQLGDNAAGVTGDLADPAAPAKVVAETVERFGRLDGLVNNAALLTRSTIDEIDADHVDAMFAVNYRAPMLTIKAALPHLEASPVSGSVVNIGSINAHCGAPNLLTYSATKGALMTASRNLGDALGGRSVRVNQVNVGWTLTENERLIQRAEGQPEDWLQRVPKELAPTGMILTPEEVAAHVAFWLSPASHPASGQAYEIEQYPLIGRNRVSSR